MKRSFFICLFLLSLPLWGSLPNHFLVVYQNQTKGVLFHLEDTDNMLVGTIEIQPSESVNSYTLYDKEEAVLATAEVSGNHTKTHGDIFDPSGKALGSFTRGRSTIFPFEYHVYGAEETELAKGVLNWVGSRFTLYDPINNHIEIATFYRPYFRMMADNWYVDVQNGNEIDLRIFAILAAYQTSLALNLERLGN